MEQEGNAVSSMYKYRVIPCRSDVLSLQLQTVDHLPELVQFGDINGEFQHDSEGSEDSESELPDEPEPTQCLFCTSVLNSVEEALQHVQQKHNLDFGALRDKFGMDQYSFLKLVNCIRTDNISAEQIINAKTPFWESERFLKPVKYEPWLTYDYEEMALTAAQLPLDVQCASTSRLQQQVQSQAAALQQASDDMEKMRSSFHRLLDQINFDTTKNQSSQASNCGGSENAMRTDQSYFNSYAHFGIHHEMLSDAVRTISYRDALLLNKDFVSGKDVLDVGCGTAVLSIFASQAGAKNVVGIDNSDIVYNAMDIVKKNGAENVQLMKGRLEETMLPINQFDIIISEWMGYFLLFEGMLDSIIYARKYHLKEGGIILPNRCTMSLIGFGDPELFRNHISFWNDVYGLDMSNMKNEVLKEPLIEVVDAQYVLTEADVIADLNMSNVDMNYSNFTYDFKLKCIKAGCLSAFVGYFNTYFDLPNPVSFGTSPSHRPTHWKQVVFFVEQPHFIEKNSTVTGTLTCRRSQNSARSLDVSIEAFGRKQTYYLD